jgi:hypothetical protein
MERIIGDHAALLGCRQAIQGWQLPTVWLAVIGSGFACR